MDHAPLLHIGYIKTGSTWLQRHLFGMAPTRTRQIGDRGELTRLMHWPTDLTYDPDAWMGAVSADLAAAAQAREVPVITHEIFTGNPTGGGWNAASMARRLHEQHPNGRVLIVVRRQADHIASAYREYVQNGGAASFDRWTEPKRSHHLPTVDFAYWEYDRLIRLYQGLFGADRVLVVPFERLVADPEGFCDTITDFCGATRLRPVPRQHERVAVGDATIALRRMTNMQFHRESSNPAAPMHITRVAGWVGGAPIPAAWHRAAHARLEQMVVKRIVEYVPDGYADSNRRVETLTGLDLSAWGYFQAARAR